MILYLQMQPLPDVYKMGLLKNFRKFTGTPLCRVLFLNKVAGLSLQLY